MKKVAQRLLKLLPSVLVLVLETNLVTSLLTLLYKACRVLWLVTLQLSLELKFAC